jgi:hypothetical protein
MWEGADTPKSWQKAIAIPVFKKGSMKHCKDYTGIQVCLLNNGYKTVTRTVNNKLEVQIMCQQLFYASSFD